MSQYTDAQRQLIQYWQADGTPWKDIQQQYNQLFDDNRTLSGLRKIGKRRRTTSYCLDRPPQKRQSRATRAPEQKVGPDLGKERETMLRLQMEVVAKLAETASRSCGDLISKYRGGST